MIKEWLSSNNLTNNWRSIIPVSGGLDSSILAFHRLHTTDDEVYLVHFEYDREGIQRESDAEAFQDVTEWLDKNCREHTVLPSIVFEHGHEQAPLWEVMGFYMAVLCKKYNADKYLFGRIATDDEEKFSRRVFASGAARFYSSLDGHAASLDTPFREMLKRDVIKLAPKDLIDLTRSCQNPARVKRQWKECGKCRACIRTMEAEEGLFPAPYSMIREIYKEKIYGT